MSWLPAFEIGLWNAWILMLYFPLHGLIMTVVDKAIGTAYSDDVGHLFQVMAIT